MIDLFLIVFSVFESEKFKKLAYCSRYWKEKNLQKILEANSAFLLFALRNQSIVQFIVACVKWTAVFWRTRYLAVTPYSTLLYLLNVLYPLSFWYYQSCHEVIHLFKKVHEIRYAKELKVFVCRKLHTLGWIKIKIWLKVERQTCFCF